MSLLGNLREDLRQDLHNTGQLISAKVTEGWRALQRSAAHALTRFTHKDDANPGGLPDTSRVSWGLVAADIHERDNQLIAQIELPGLVKSDLDIEVHARHLVITGQKSRHQERDEGRWHIRERSYGAFRRSIPLPCEVTNEGCDAKLDHGVLTVRMNKRNVARRIEVV